MGLVVRGTWGGSRKAGPRPELERSWSLRACQPPLPGSDPDAPDGPGRQTTLDSPDLQ